MTQVKICGIRTAEHAIAALEAGADMLGLIFAPSRRQVAPADAATLVSAVRAAPGGRAVRIAGVFVNEAPARILELAEACGLDIIQLSGEEPVAQLAELGGREVLKTVRLAGAPGEQEWLGAAHAGRARLHVDAHVPGEYGGAGVLGDWELAAGLAAREPILMAGGLTPENVADAIRRVRPWGVDVSSGVETGGVKDSLKIGAFVAAARAAGPR